jgi:hypothetical protein
MKIPQHVAKEIFYKTARAAEVVKTTSTFLHRGCCPLCNDYKKRMYIKEYSDCYQVYCHNCGYSHKLEVFLKTNYPEEFKNLKPYIIEAVRNGTAFKKFYTNDEPIVKTMTDQEINTKLVSYLPRVSFNIMAEQVSPRLEKYRAYCLKYLIDRRIPDTIFRDFLCIHGGPLAGYVGIPFYDQQKTNLIHVQGRLVLSKKNLPKKQEKYMFLKDTMNGIELESKPTWGKWRIQKDEIVIICEGTLDACAFENGASTCGATLSESFIRRIRSEFPNRVWCVDNYFLDVAGRDLTNRLLAMGEDCFIIPKDMVENKDANDLIKNVFTDKQYIPMSFVRTNTYKGKIGLAKLKMVAN